MRRARSARAADGGLIEGHIREQRKGPARAGPFQSVMKRLLLLAIPVESGSIRPARPRPHPGTSGQWTWPRSCSRPPAWRPGSPQRPRPSDPALPPLARATQIPRATPLPVEVEGLLLVHEFGVPCDGVAIGTARCPDILRTPNLQLDVGPPIDRCRSGGSEGRGFVGPATRAAVRTCPTSHDRSIRVISARSDLDLSGVREALWIDCFFGTSPTRLAAARDHFNQASRRCPCRKFSAENTRLCPR